jgi:hypothetical protein
MKKYVELTEKTPEGATIYKLMKSKQKGRPAHYIKNGIRYVHYKKPVVKVTKAPASVPAPAPAEPVTA